MINAYVHNHQDFDSHVIVCHRSDSSSCSWNFDLDYILDLFTRSVNKSLLTVLHPDQAVSNSVTTTLKYSLVSNVRINERIKSSI